MIKYLKKVGRERKEKKVLVSLISLYDIFNKDYFGEFINESDVRIMKEDWKIVGSDIRWGMEEVKQELGKKAV